MLYMKPLFSSSSGNSTYIGGENNGLLVDAGVSCKRIFEKLGDEVKNIRGILVTHEHSDHIMSVGAMARKLKVPVYATRKTFENMNIGDVSEKCVVLPGEQFSAAGITVTPFSIPHDAADPVGYSFVCGGEKVTVATDIGYMDDSIFLSVSGSSQVLLESNYDKKMLINGSYPEQLKKRIGGKYGHLSNEEAASVCARLVSLGTQKIFLGHLSRENNLPDIAYKTCKKSIEGAGAIIGKDVILKVV